VRAVEEVRGAWWPLAFGLALILGLLLVPPARAAEMTGRVVGIIDGDTIDVLMPGLQVVRVRLSGIDAPERGQAFGTAAKAALSELVFARQVVVQWKKRDRYERLVGKVTVSGVDANLAMVTRGMAWHYVRFEAEQEQADRAIYAQAEREARAQRRGLWADPMPLAPWDFRKATTRGQD
jgi:endonuclease YncB( thermonuclease family)